MKKLKKYVELNSDECGMRKRAVGGIYVPTCWVWWHSTSHGGSKPDEYYTL